MIYQVTHRTVYGYSEPAALSQNDVCLTVRNTPYQTCESTALDITPKPSSLSVRRDFFGNQVHQFMVQLPHEELAIVTQSRVTTFPGPVPDAASSPPWESVRGLTGAPDDPGALDAAFFMYPSQFVRPSRKFYDYALPSFPPGRPVLEGAMDLTGRIYTDFKYEKDATQIGTPIEKVLENRKGVCQDFAHLQIACFRSMNIAARYVSGYLETLPPPGKVKLAGADASHAWLSIFVPGLGWVDLDPTNNMIPAERHITVAWGRDYADVTPVKGIVWGGGSHRMNVSVDVSPVA